MTNMLPAFSAKDWEKRRQGGSLAEFIQQDDTQGSARYVHAPDGHDCRSYIRDKPTAAAAYGASAGGIRIKKRDIRKTFSAWRGLFRMSRILFLCDSMFKSPRLWRSSAPANLPSPECRCSSPRCRPLLPAVS